MAKSTNCSESRTSSTRTPNPTTKCPLFSASSHKSPPKLATFEDEQKPSCWRNAEEQQAKDLQAANRYAKSMVRAEDQKVERYHKRRRCWSQWLVRLKLCGEMFESLQAFRPTLFGCASEAAENNNEGNNEEQAQWMLADILALNDQINVCLQAFQQMNGPPQPASTSKDLISIWESCNNPEDVNILSAANSPAIVRRAIPSKGSASSSNAWEKENCLVDQSPQMSNIIEELKDLDLIQAKPSEITTNHW
uniref:Uncharacterized protein n=1 Tax=Ditylenchus dipsaci TaxID=166011 RepID=A0A915E6M3_9BILA